MVPMNGINSQLAAHLHFSATEMCDVGCTAGCSTGCASKLAPRLMYSTVSNTISLFSSMESLIVSSTELLQGSTCTSSHEAFPLATN